MQLLSSSSGIKFYGDSLTCCIGFIDLVNSTNNVITIEDSKKIRTYYSKFINSLYKITKKFNIKIIKNIGDCIFFYAPSTTNTESIKPFCDLFTCIYSILDERDKINKDLFESNLPSFNYRISVDHGYVELALVGEYSQLDLFGTTVNICSKINSITNPNEINIGEKLYRILKSLSIDKQYDFIPIDEYWLPNNQPYLLYSVRRKLHMNSNDSIVSNKNTKLSSYVTTTINKKSYNIKNRKTIVIVEDNKEDLYCYKLFLEDLKYNVICFNDPTLALKYILSDIFNNNMLIITDIRMNKLNGLELYQKLKLIRPNIKILFVTALDIVNEIRSVICNTSSYQIVRKPVDKKILLNNITNLFEDKL